MDEVMKRGSVGKRLLVKRLGVGSELAANAWIPRTKVGRVTRSGMVWGRGDPHRISTILRHHRRSAISTRSMSVNAWFSPPMAQQKR